MMNRIEIIDLQLKIAKAKSDWCPTVKVSTLLLEEILKKLTEVPYIALQPELDLEEELGRMNANTLEYVAGFVIGHNSSLQEAKKNVERAGYGVMHWEKPREIL